MAKVKVDVTVDDETFTVYPELNMVPLVNGLIKYLRQTDPFLDEVIKRTQELIHDDRKRLAETRIAP